MSIFSLNATAAGEIETLQKVADSSQPTAKAVYDRIIAAAKSGQTILEKDKAVLRMDRAHFQKNGKADVVAAIDWLLQPVSKTGPAPTVVSPEEALEAATVAFRQVDGDMDNGEVTGANADKLRAAVEAGIASVRGEKPADPSVQADRLLKAAQKADKEAGGLSPDDAEEARAIAGAYRKLAGVLTSASVPAAAPAAPAMSPTTTTPPSVPTPPVPAAGPSPSNPGGTAAPGATRSLPATTAPAAPATPPAPKVLRTTGDTALEAYNKAKKAAAPLGAR